MDRIASTLSPAAQNRPTMIPLDGEQDCACVIAAAVPLFPDRLRRQCRIVVVGGGEVFSLNEPAASLYCVLRGDVSVQRDVMGERVTLQRAAPGDWLVEPHLFTTQTDAFALCERQSTFLALSAKALVDRLQRDPLFAGEWCRVLGVQVVRQQRQVERLRLLHASKRVAHYLATESVGGCGEMVLPYSKGTWAAHLGITAESLSRTLTEMIVAGRLEKLEHNRYRLIRAN